MTVTRGTGVMEAIGSALQGGALPADLVREGFARSTVYKVANQLAEDAPGEMRRVRFRTELATLLNRSSRENGSDTPDFILARYLTWCLEAFDAAVTERERWYSRSPHNSEVAGGGF